MKKLATRVSAVILAMGLASGAHAVDLIAAGGGDGDEGDGAFLVGTVEVDLDAMTITYDITDSGWFLVETHVAVDYDNDCANVPVTRSGNPKTGKFPGGEEFEVDSEVEAITHSVGDVLGADDDGDGDGEFCVAAHATVAMTTTVDGEEVTVTESAWAVVGVSTLDSSAVNNDAWVSKNWSNVFNVSNQ